MEAFSLIHKLRECYILASTSNIDPNKTAKFLDKEVTFSEHMKAVKVYLKCLENGNQPSQILNREEYEIFGKANLMDGLVWYYMVPYIEGNIKWFKDILTF